MGKLGNPFCITDLTGQFPEKHQWEKLVNQSIGLPRVFSRKPYTEVQ